MTFLPELNVFTPRWLHRSAGAFLLFLSLALALPSAGFASINQDVREAINLLEQKNYSQALDLLHDIEARIPNPDEISNLLAVAYLGRGYQLLADNDFSAARKAFWEGRQYNGDDVRHWQGEAMTWFKQGQYADAASVLNDALGIDSQNADIYHLMGKSYYADGRMAEAVDALTRSRDLDDNAKVAALLEKVRKEWQIEQEMGQESRGHFQLSFVDGEHVANLAVAIIETLEDAYSELGTELNFYPDVRIPVLLYTHKDFSSVTNSPDWAGAVYDGKIRLPLGGMHQMTEPLAALLYHEYMHVLIHFMSNRHAPVWLNEGLAELAGRYVYSHPEGLVQKAIETKQLISWEKLVKPFSALDASEVPLAYEQSYSLVSFMIDRFGWHKMTELLQSIGERQPWQSAVADVYRDYGLNWSIILEEWQASLR